MAVSYKKLFKMLIDKNMMKKDLQAKTAKNRVAVLHADIGCLKRPMTEETC